MKCKDIFCFFNRNSGSDGKKVLLESVPVKKKTIRETRKWVPHNKTKPLPYPVKQLELHKGEEPSMLITTHGPKTAKRVSHVLDIYVSGIGYEQGGTPKFNFRPQKGSHQFLVHGDMAAALRLLHNNRHISESTKKEALNFFEPSARSTLQY